MADEQNPAVTEDLKSDSVPAQNDADGGGKQPAGDAPKTMTLTQEEFDAKVKDRIERATEKARREAEKEKSEAEAKALEEQGKYQQLYEAEKAKAEKAQQERQELERAGWRKDATAKHKLPAQWAERLRGETAEEIDADAAELAKTMPKPGAPSINATENDRPPANIKTEANRKEFERAVRRM
ncbi:MAG: hypothetical protein ACOYD4_06920 [Solirubrobacterales bacterium]